MAIYVKRVIGGCNNCFFVSNCPNSSESALKTYNFYLWCVDNTIANGVFAYYRFRHATPEEIKRHLEKLEA